MDDGEPNSNTGGEGSGAVAGIRGRTFAFTAGGDPIPGGGPEIRLMQYLY